MPVRIIYKPAPTDPPAEKPKGKRGPKKRPFYVYEDRAYDLMMAGEAPDTLEQCADAFAKWGKTKEGKDALATAGVSTPLGFESIKKRLAKRFKSDDLSGTEGYIAAREWHLMVRAARERSDASNCNATN